METKLQIKNIDGEVIKESNINVGENDTIVITFPKGYSPASTSKVFEAIKNKLESGGIIGVPEGFGITIISKK